MNRAHCRKGHPRTPENTYVYPDGIHIQCRTCKEIGQERRATRHLKKVTNMPRFNNPALCAELPFDVVDALFFPEGSGSDMYDRTARICNSCPAIDECARYVLDMEASQPKAYTYGYWAGMRAVDRLNARRKRDAA